MIKHFDQKEQKFLRIDQQIQRQNIQFSEKQSEFQSEYAKLINSIQINHHNLQQIFNYNNISFNSQQLHQQFTYQVERVLPYLNFYRLHVKISHFKLRINVAEYAQTNLFTNKSDNQGSYSKVYFTEFRGKSLCIKSFPINNQEEFVKIFRKAVKQWTILKICSTLECAPYLQSYLGFDLIVYDDCIQFALQRGSQIKHLDSLQIAQLKKQLRLIHEFNIIHCDIKPQNITFSHHFNKPVYIDFGFSQVIHQSLGYKTLSTFKGTPRFCTKQMLALILNKKDFIDLYYNDAYTLQQTCRYFSQSIIQQQQQTVCYFLSEKIDYLKWMSQKKVESSLMFLCMQYHYVIGKQQKLRQLLKEYLKINPQNIKKVLLFIKKCVNYKFLPQFFKQDLKQFSGMLQYQQIKLKIKLGGEAVYLGIDQYDQQTSKRQSRLITSNLQMPQLNNNYQGSCYQNYLRIIFKIQKIQSQMIGYFLAIVYQCVRFDQHNIDFSKKVKIANKMNPLLQSYLQTNFIQNNIILLKQMKDEQTSDLTQIKLLIRLILNVCLKQKQNKWVNDNLFKILQQLIIINDGYIITIARIVFSFILQNQTAFDPFFIFNQLQQLLKIISLMNSQLQVLAELDRLIQDFAKNFKIKQIQKIFEECSFPEDENMPQTYLRKLSQIQNFENPHKKKKLFQLLILQAHSHIASSGKIMQIIKIIQFVKKSPYFYNYSSLLRCKVMIDLMDGVGNMFAVSNYLKSIANVINCPQIYQTINWQQYFAFNQFSLQSKISSLIYKFTLQIPLDTDIYYQIIEISKSHLYQIKDKDLKKELFLLYATYLKQRSKIKDKNNQKAYRKYLSVYQRVIIQGFFYKLSFTTRDAFIMTLEQYQCQLTKLDIEQKEQSRWLKYKITLYKWYLTLLDDTHLKQQYIQCCMHLQQLIAIFQENRFYSLIIRAISDMCWACLSWMLPQQYLIYSITQLFNYSKTINQLVYLTQFNYITPTLAIFARFNRPAFTQLLLNLTEFLSANLYHSTKNYFMNLLRDIDWFVKSHIENSHLIHYSNFVKNGSTIHLRANPYLLIFYAYSLYHQSTDSQLRLLKIFAKNCDFLTNFAKKKLFERYFRVFVIYMRTKSKRQRIYVFRLAKNYIGSMKDTQFKILFKTGKKSIFISLLKKKMVKFIKQ